MPKFLLLFFVSFAIFHAYESKFIINDEEYEGYVNAPILVYDTSKCYYEFKGTDTYRYKCEVKDGSHKFFLAEVGNCSIVPNDEDYIDFTESLDGYSCKDLNEETLILHYTDEDYCNTLYASRLFKNPKSCNRINVETSEKRHQTVKIIDGKAIIDIFTDKECKESEGVKLTFDLKKCKKSILYNNFIKYEAIGFDNDEESSGSNAIYSNGFIVVIISLISMIFFN